MNETELTSETAPRWTLIRTGVYAAIVAIVFIAVQIAVMVVDFAILATKVAEPNADEWASQIGSNGSFVTWSVICTTMVCAPLVVYMAKRREPNPWHFLRLVPTKVSVILKWCLVLAAFVFVADSITILLGRPVVPQFMTDVYASAEPLPLFIALVVAAPLFEELFFRGLLIGALDSAGVRMSLSAIFSSLAWAAIHSQYDIFGIGIIFLMGLTLALARYRTQSLIPCLAMHALANAIAFTEAALAAA